MKAKFVCHQVNKNADGTEGVTLISTHEKGSVNKDWSHATEASSNAGSIGLTITNEKSHGQFQRGKEYDVVISEAAAESAPAAAAKGK